MDEEWKKYVPNCTLKEYLERVRISNDRYKGLQQLHEEAHKEFEDYIKEVKDGESRET